MFPVVKKSFLNRLAKPEGTSSVAMHLKLGTIITPFPQARGYEKRYFGEAGKQKLSKVKLRRDPVTSRKVFERTWEVILDTTGQYSYNIRANPEYGAHLKQ